MTEETARLSFRCQGCLSIINVTHLVLFRNGTIHFFGECSGCGTDVRTDSSMAELANTILDIPKEPKQIEASEHAKDNIWLHQLGIDPNEDHVD